MSKGYLERKKIIISSELCTLEITQVLKNDPENEIF